MPSPRLISQLSVTGILTIGLTLSGAMIGAILYSIGSSLFSVNPPKNSEHLQITREGVPIISTTIGGNDTHRVFRTLAGTVVDESHVSYFGSKSLGVAPKVPGAFAYPLTWLDRLSNTSDLANPSTFWHLIRSPTPQGHAYFAGYDSVSKRQVGFLGRKGFRDSLPREEEWFDVGYQEMQNTDTFFASDAGTNSAEFYNGWNYRSHSVGQDGPWVGIGFLIDGPQILRIDFQHRMVNFLANMPGSISISLVSEIDEPIPNATENSTVLLALTENVASKKINQKDLPRVRRLLVRYPERIVVWDLESQQPHREYPLDRSLQDHELSAYLLDNGQLLLEYENGYWEQGRRRELVWLDLSGKPLHEESVNLLGWSPRTEYQEARDAACIAPLPAYWIYRLLWQRPIELLAEQESLSYQMGFARVWQASRWIVLAISVLSGLAAMICWRWQILYSRSDSVWWIACVFLFGIGGLVAYRLLHGKPTLDTCPECGKQVPRNRDACARCQQPFAEPELLGTEVFV